MNKYDMIMNHLSQFHINEELLECVNIFLNRIWKIAPQKLEALDLDNIGMTYSDELLIEWIIKNYYVQVRIRETETRCEAKLPNGERHYKHHPLSLKVVESTIQSLDKILEI